MSTIGRFISPAKIKQEAYVDENVDEQKLSNSILACQELYTKEILGTALYDQVKSQIELSTLSANNTTLLNSYIRPALKYWVLYDVLPLLSLQITNKGVIKKRSENSDQATADEILKLTEYFRNLAERWDDKMRLYLIENSSTFTLYLNPGSATDTVHPKGMTYGTGWFLGSSRNADDCCDDTEPITY